ncbi:WecB/TagA/CpsF family glycosyltransferase [Sphingobacterium bambusae]|uniref:WecB/TagA/CpsF family glycosyltransferase n=1 Tax=Sphingobacterium bambusae TaxID=662858 RepID=A0ABW6BB87_9SPHI|nr:WecB/TagA/CpsF family glycosyltransferase [Sphingobacterium bambusae]WPL46886.1 WecB/TagA/CpsF family glycosyltransferase [Sphingobacterium bambusae]
MQDKIKIFNAEILNVDMEELLNKLDRGVLITPNVDHLMKLQKDEEFYNLYKQTEWLICDSKIVQLGLKFLGKPVKEVIPGSSFFPAYYMHHKSNKEVNIFLLGAAEGVAEKASQKINSKVGRPIIVDYQSPSFGFEKDEVECQAIVRRINESNATVLVVGVGAPKQEKWIFKYKDQMPNIRLFMALGATIDFEAGNITRAPRWMQRLSLEWLYRMSKEPKRLWKRYMVDDLPFFGLILREKLNRYSDPFAKS